jgi:hypothetical protein
LFNPPLPTPTSIPCTDCPSYPPSPITLSSSHTHAPAGICRCHLPRQHTDGSSVLLKFKSAYTRIFSGSSVNLEVKARLNLVDHCFKFNEFELENLLKPELKYIEIKLLKFVESNFNSLKYVDISLVEIY